MDGQAPGFDWITPALAVGGAFPEAAAPLLASEHGLRAVIDMRAEDRDDAAALAAAGLGFLHLPTQDHCAPEPWMLDRGVAFARRAMADGGRVLIHCREGVGRSAAMALCVMVADGWAPMEALSHAKDRRRFFSPSPAQYRAWAEWLERWKARRGAAWTVPDFEAFKAVAYRHLTAA